MTLPVPVNPESVFTYGAPALKFGAGASDEIGFDLAQLGVGRVLVITDPGVAATGTPQRVAEQMAGFGIVAQVFDGVHVEPTDVSMRRAIDYARGTGPWDAFVAVGGGSAIDTAKAVNLLLTNPGDLMDYINAPVGGGLAPVNVLKPLVADLVLSPEAKARGYFNVANMERFVREHFDGVRDDLFFLVEGRRHVQAAVREADEPALAGQRVLIDQHVAQKAPGAKPEALVENGLEKLVRPQMALQQNIDGPLAGHPCGHHGRGIGRDNLSSADQHV